MLFITGYNQKQLNELDLTRLERQIVEMMRKSPESDRYESLDQLLFELRLRQHTVQAAIDMGRSGAVFAIFEQSFCNQMFWRRTWNGGFALRRGVLPSVAIRDIFQQGWLYGYECATAIIIILYKAVLDSLGDRLFNMYFQDLYLRDWNNDSDLHLRITMNNVTALPGDALYFKNPDVNPATPYWQGENVIMLDKDLYFGHGVGAHTAAGMIAILNEQRAPGSTQSAYLQNLNVRPGYYELWKMKQGNTTAMPV